MNNASLLISFAAPVVGLVGLVAFIAVIHYAWVGIPPGHAVLLFRFFESSATKSRRIDSNLTSRRSLLTQWLERGTATSNLDVRLSALNASATSPSEAIRIKAN